MSSTKSQSELSVGSPAPLLIDLRTAAQMLSVSVCEMRKLTRSKKSATLSTARSGWSRLMTFASSSLGN